MAWLAVQTVLHTLAGRHIASAAHQRMGESSTCDVARPGSLAQHAMKNPRRAAGTALGLGGWVDGGWWLEWVGMDVW